MPFCEVHGREAELSARLELAAVLQDELTALEGAERERAAGREVVLAALEKAAVPGLDVGNAEHKAHAAALLEAYLPERLAGNTDAETLRFDYARDECKDGPVEWWNESHELLTRFVREASGQGLSWLAGALESLRERAAVQRSVFEFDLGPREARAMMERVEALISPDEDTVRLYRLCSTCLTETRILGEGTLSLDPDFYIV